ncbi:DMT family transporter [Marinomonas epiphytica]
MTYVLLCLAVLAEVIATTALKSSDSFTKIVPVTILVVGYGVSFYLLSIVMKTLPTGITYAIWSGLGVVFISVIAFVYHNEKLDWPAIIGLFFIILGVAVINVFSKSVSH